MTNLTNTRITLANEVHELTYCNQGACYGKQAVTFWGFVLFSILTSFTAILGNSLVIYAGSRTVNKGRLKYLDGMVKSLAMTDLLYGLVATPFNFVNYYLCK